MKIYVFIYEVRVRSILLRLKVGSTKQFNNPRFLERPPWTHKDWEIKEKFAFNSGTWTESLYERGAYHTREWPLRRGTEPDPSELQFVRRDTKIPTESRGGLVSGLNVCITVDFTQDLIPSVSVEEEGTIGSTGGLALSVLHTYVKSQDLF